MEAGKGPGGQLFTFWYSYMQPLRLKERPPRGHIYAYLCHEGVNLIVNTLKINGCIITCSVQSDLLFSGPPARAPGSSHHRQLCSRATLHASSDTGSGTWPRPPHHWLRFAAASANFLSNLAVSERNEHEFIRSYKLSEITNVASKQRNELLIIKCFHCYLLSLSCYVPFV